MTNEEALVYASQFVPDRVFGMLIARWSEGHRFYHNLSHLFSMVSDLYDMVVLYDICPEDEALLIKMALFHDAVYEPGRKDNEAQSAALAYQCLPAAEAIIIASAIMKTVDHKNPESFLEACLLDADLANLGRNYSANGDNIYLEYLPVITHEDQWFMGRVAFLTGMLDRQSIFYTSWGAKYEEPAQVAMGADLAFNKRLLGLD